MREYKIACIAIKDNMVDNIMLFDNEHKGIEHAKYLKKAYGEERVSQIVVFKVHDEGWNEKIYEFISQELKGGQ